MDSKAGQGTKTARVFDRRKIRQATFVLPTTGERVRRDVTLRDPRFFASLNGNNERAPLLPQANQAPKDTRVQALRGRAKEFLVVSYKDASDFVKTPAAHGIFKCSIAYLIATLLTFSAPFARLIGTHQDGNQLIANIVVWFDPNRTAGSMDLGILFAFLAFLYGCVMAFGSQAVSAFFVGQNLMVTGHVVVLLLFCWGGLGLLAWFKQYMSHPLVNTASSLASLAIITCLTKEGVVQRGDFSYERIIQVLKSLVIGITLSYAVNLLVWPSSARTSLRENLMMTTDAFGDLLTTVASCFLSGSDEDLNHPAMATVSDKFKTAYAALPSQLAEARYEHHPLGTETQYHIEARLVKCVQRLAQDMGGLRSAAATQFALLSESNGPKLPKDTVPAAGSIPAPGSVPAASPPIGSVGPIVGSPPSIGTVLSRPATSVNSPPDRPYLYMRRASSLVNQGGNLDQSPFGSPGEDFSHGQQSVTEAQANAPAQQPDSSSVSKTTAEGYIGPAQTPAQIFDTFIEHLGPHMKSLAYTLREILKALPYASNPGRSEGSLARFRHSLNDALKLFNTSRKEALVLVYKSKPMSQAASIQVAADFEEVAASCGQFSSSLEDFAEGCLAYLDVLDDLELEINERPHGRTWNWLMFWKYRVWWDKDLHPSDPFHFESAPGVNVTPGSALNAAPSTTQEKALPKQKFPYSLYPHLRWFRREDVKFAIKVGGGATFFAMWAFIPEIKPWYDHWHMEWALVSYMLVCSMNIGTSNYTGWSRSYGTLFGAITGIIVWIICREQPYALAFCTWIVSLVCFYFIIAKGQGPMGRFILLTYNLSVLSSFALTLGDPDVDPDEPWDALDSPIFEIALHRMIGVLIGVFGGLIVTHYIWPISARKKVKTGLSLLWLRMGLIWKQGPLTILLPGGGSVPTYMDIRRETGLRDYVDTLEGLRKSAESEFQLKGPFPTESFDALIQSTTRMLDAFHALNVVVSKDLKATPGEAEILNYTQNERQEVGSRVSHMLSVLAASLNMEYPLNDTLPKLDNARDRLLAKIFEFRQSDTKQTDPSDDDYELLYCYALVTGQIAKEVSISGDELAKLYESLGEKVLKLQ